ncbi:hypothetical protein [Tepidibacter hydrothermalis]|uniref:Uncharacterized protein n=1 Tax=Tepidibacter hydrothermalis TaxID=3036126 RepID=A0ABY8EAV9_9FIRM|nr:hypothetical protein [Tepidibacter hydrothermalis]WFD09025.1 hypothetical protein P4S50_11575 [Tepidibacter hydrothermalis]
MKGVKFKNSQEFAREMYNAIRSKHKRYTLRPQNRFSNETSSWWLIPSTDLNGFKYGKYIFDDKHYKCDDAYCKKITTGIYIEKGVKCSQDSNKIMNEDWVWNEFINALENGDIEDILHKIVRKIEKDIEHIDIRIKVDIQDKDSIEIVYNNKFFINKETGKRVKIKELKEDIENTPSIDWLWADFYILFSFNKITKEDENYFDEIYIRDFLLEPFEKWIK